jgi:hypothetical protein
MTNKPLKPLMIWSMACLSIVVIPLFAILIWQLIALDPERYCKLVQQNGIPPGNNCYNLLTQGLHIKGWVIWGLLATLAAFVLTVLVALVKAKINVVGPAGTQVSIGGTDVPKT